MSKPQIHIEPSTDFLGRISGFWPALWQWLGDMETRAVSSRLPLLIDGPLYICGLARSGTTILLELLSENAGMASHKYRDFPFLFTPVMWDWFYRKARKKPSTESAERAHKDGIMITLESPEAMEEILWMRFFPHSHDSRYNNVLTPHDENPSFDRFYLDHIRKILFLRGGSKYLSKGNYNLSRMQYLQKLFPDAKFVIPFRNPLAHIASLMKQHTLFSAEERRDRRILNHMRRSGHFEFGLNRVPINFGNTAEILDIQALWSDGEEVRGWAKYWASVYRFVIQTLENMPSLSGATLLLHYEQLCEAPYNILKLLYDHCGISFEDALLQKQAQCIASPGYYSPSFSDEEKEIIYEETNAVMNQLLQYAPPLPLS